jgi:hypothetical protein
MEKLRPIEGFLGCTGFGLGVCAFDAWREDLEDSDYSAIAGCRKRRIQIALDAQAIFCRRRHQPRRPPRPAPTMGPGMGLRMRCLKKKSVLTDVEGQHAQATS